MTASFPRSLLQFGGLTLLFAALLSTAGDAHGQSLGPSSTTGGLNTAPIGRMRLSFSLVPAPIGTFKTNFLGTDVSRDMAFAFGLRPAFDYSINNYFFVGVATQYIFNVKDKGDSNGAAQELDLLLRLGGHAPVADNLHLYGYLAPGYSIIYRSEGDENATGFALGVGGGGIYSVPGSRLFAVADIGYQLGYHEYTVLGADVDWNVNYLLIGLGLGMKL